MLSLISLPAMSFAPHIEPCPDCETCPPMMVPPPPPPKITDFSQVKFIDELARPDHVKPHFLGVDPLAGEPRLSCRGIEGKNCTKDGDFRSTLGPKLAAEYAEYTHLTVPTGTVHGQPGFYHGVASGSPTTSAVVVWTRYTPASPTDVVPVTLVMDKAGASALSAASPIKMTVMAEAKNDWVIKIDVTHLPAGTDFVYAFIAAGKQSMVGMTKTAPDGPTAEMHYALFSCSHWAQGYFHPYDHGSILEKLDWWVHVGDYIYEYGVSTADDFSDRMWGYRAHRWPTKERMDPPWEIVELNDYRRRYAVYHTDHGLQQLRARAPMIATWDDHEITNNWFFQGAQNHQSTCPADATACDEHEGSWVERVNAGAIAYLEWLPIRRGPDDQSGLMNTDIKQVIEWGDLATIVSVDTRGYARSADYVGGWQKPGVRIASGHYPDGNPNSAVSAFLGQGKGGYAQTIFEEVVDPTNSYTFDQLTTPGEEAYDKAIAFKEQIKGVRMDPSRKKLGEYQMEFMMEKFAASKEAGKTWQIFADATTEAAWSGPDLRKGCSAVPENETACLAFTQDKIDNAPSGFYNWKTLAAISAHQIALYNDDSNACAYERMMMMRGWKETTNNLISLSGDVHDSRADVLFTDGEATGTPEGVHFTQGGVTCQWWGDTAGPHGVTGLAQEFGLNNGMKIAEQALEESTAAPPRQERD